MVVDENGEPIAINEFMRRMGKLLHVDIDDYCKSLSVAKSSGVRDETQTRIFDDLKRSFQKNYLDK